MAPRSPEFRLAATVAAAALIVLLVSPRAFAGFPPPGGSWDPARVLTVGSSVAWRGGEDWPNELVTGVEATFAGKINAPLFWWGSAGYRLSVSEETRGSQPYGELGLGMLFFNLGAGYGPVLASGEDPVHLMHVFVGLSIPLWTPCGGNLLYVEPYYRPSWTLEEESHGAHELGLMLRWFFSLRSD